jgi:predicted lipoprotein with Yx(FWY)xxD motif
VKKNSTMLIGIVVVIIVAVGAYAIFHNSSNNNSSTNAYGSSQPSTTKPSSQKPTSSGSIIQTKTASSIGQYLADNNGNALYTYGADTSGVSNCSGSCIADWPIYQPGPTTSLPTNVTVITRSDGSKQYAYKGLPLYTFTSDSSGRVTGDDVSNFHVARP